jgi:hypothetical protein
VGDCVRAGAQAARTQPRTSIMADVTRIDIGPSSAGIFSEFYHY